MSAIYGQHRCEPDPENGGRCRWCVAPTKKFCESPKVKVHALEFYLKLGHDFTNLSPSQCIRCALLKRDIVRTRAICGWAIPIKTNSTKTKPGGGFID